jgi:hypothetical protein
MLWRVFLSLMLFAAVSAWAQVEPSASGGSSTADDTEQMMTPPPVSGQAYPTEVGAEEQSNYLRGGLVFNASYVDNLYAGSATTASEKIYTILPTISYDQVLPRQHISLIYSPGFTFYEPSSVLNEVDQDLNASYQYRLTPHIKLSGMDAFQRSSTAYGLGDSVAGGAVSGSAGPVTPGIIAPFAERQTNSASAQFSYQFSPVGMIGASGNQMNLDFPNPTQATGLYNSIERGGGGFYNRRLNATQYLGVNYQYAWTQEQPAGTTSVTQTHTIDGFYSIYPRPSFSISISGGPQHYALTETGVLTSGGWGPSVTASLGWQGPHTNVAASYSRQVTSGGGLVGVFRSNDANLSARWQLSRVWTTGISGNYATNNSITALSLFPSLSGHSISGQATLGYMINKELNLNLEYDRLHQSYAGVAAIASNPNSDRVMVSLAWQFARPLGR